MERLIIYTGNFIFPDGNAAGKRVLGNTKAIQAAGYRVACVCFRKDRMNDGLLVDEVDGVCVYSIPYAQGLKRMNNAKAKRAFMEAFSDLKSKYKVHAVIMYGTLGTAAYNFYVIRICRNHQINVIYDLVDMFDDPLKNNYPRYVIKKIDFWLLINRIIPACDKWIAISSYLQQRMPDPSKTIIVPPLAVDVRSCDAEDVPQCTTFAYASLINEKNIPVSGWKDRVDAIVDAFYVLFQERKEKNFRLHFIGFTSRDLINQFPECERASYQEKLRVLDENVVFHGLMKNQEAQKLIGQSDFTILIRDSKTCTNAGFPTKVSESLSLGVPVVANLTSDIAMYVHDGVNGFEIPGPDNISAIADKLSMILSLTREQKDVMRKNTVSNKPFYYMNYVEKLRTFLEL